MSKPAAFDIFSFSALLAAAVLHYEGLTVSALILRRILLVSSDMDFVE